MSTKYKHGDEVPNAVIADRLDELSKAVTKGRDAVDREFTMRIPAELDRDADLVLSQAAMRIRELSKNLEIADSLVPFELTEELYDRYSNIK